MRKQNPETAKHKLHILVDSALKSNSNHAILIREFTHKALDAAPESFWIRMASTTGKYHRGETLAEHTQYAITVGHHIVRMMTEGTWGPIWNNLQVACFYSAVILHDVFSSGPSGQERRDPATQELRTDPFHMIYPQFLLRNIKVAGKPAWTYPWYQEITDAIAYHYGPWTPLASLSPLDLRFSDIRICVFLADYFASRNDIVIKQ